MAHFRVEIHRGGRYELLHGRVEARTAEEAIAYVKGQLPHRCRDHKLRARLTKRSLRITNLLQAAVAAEGHDG